MRKAVWLGLRCVSTLVFLAAANPRRAGERIGQYDLQFMPMISSSAAEDDQSIGPFFLPPVLT